VRSQLVGSALEIVGSSGLSTTNSRPGQLVPGHATAARAVIASTRAREITDVHSGARRDDRTMNRDFQAPDGSAPVVVIGAGPAGLAAAGALALVGVEAVVLERSSHIGSHWRDHRASLRLHTTRRWSGLPGLPIDSSYGRYVRSSDMVRYWDAYVDAMGLTICLDVGVARIEPGPSADPWRRWTVVTDDGREIAARSVVIATGRNAVPRMPALPGLASFGRPILHASALQHPDQLRGRSVLVIGAGNAGAEASIDLLAAGAERVWMSVRQPPHVVRPRIGPWSTQSLAVALEHLPTRLADRVAALQRRLTVPDLRPYGLPLPVDGMYSRLESTQSVPVQDTGIVDAIARGAVVPVAETVGFTESTVLLADGSVLSPDAVVAATGYAIGPDLLRPSILGQMEGAAPTAVPEQGLHVLGFEAPASGLLRAISRGSREIATKEAAYARIVARQRGRRTVRRPKASARLSWMAAHHAR
jgi:putative flavoprotein involved in K+ transport